MQVQTSLGNVYSYLRRTGEIVPGVEDDDSFVWPFAPLQPFSAMSEVDMFIIGITEQCNLRCTYCCYSGEYANNRSHNSRSLTRRDIDEIYAFIVQTTTLRPLRISFYGGEPLTQYDLVQYAIKCGKEVFEDQVAFSITTNATLLTEERTNWLIAHDVNLEISIDGTASFHDRNRIDKNGRGSFSRMYQALGYIAKQHPSYLLKVKLLMTLPSIVSLLAISEEWHNDPLLHNIAPSSISGLTPNFAQGVVKKNYEVLKEQHLPLLDAYERHQDWLVLKAYFNDCIAYWRDRPIVDVGDSVPMSTCMPRNTKLFIDANKQIGVCEKISDNYRIGSVQTGVDWEKANEHVRSYYAKRFHRCAHCPAIRMCDMCLKAIEFNNEQWDILCHNEREYARLYMFLFCEMAERGLIG